MEAEGWAGSTLEELLPQRVEPEGEDGGLLGLDEHGEWRVESVGLVVGVSYEVVEEAESGVPAVVYKIVDGGRFDETRDG